MRTRTSARHRWAFTLVEMLVVIALILILMTIAAAMFPRFAENQRLIKGADQISTMALNARMRALRDRVPVGIRIEFEGTGANLVAARLIYIKQVDDFSKPNTRCLGVDPNPNPPPPAGLRQILFSPATFQFDAPYFGAQAELAAVLNGDYLEVNGGGLVTMIDGVVREAPFNKLYTLSTVPAGPYRIIRQPRPVEGEPPLELPQNIVIHAGWSQDLPVRNVYLGDPRVPPQSRPAQSYKQYAEILFAPGGGVVGRGTTTGGNIILWVRDVTKEGQLEGSPLLVSIHTRTGLIAVHPVNTGDTGDPANLYQFTKDGRSSGL